MNNIRPVIAAGIAVLLVGPIGSFEVKAEVSELLVTTRKREEMLSDVPISIQAFSIQQIGRLNLNDVDDVAQYSPSIIFDQSGSVDSTRIAIRGLSPTRGRANAAILVDGIDVTSEGIAVAGGGLVMMNRLLDIERVEIAKGPQSVLYGRSAFAGGIQYITRDPADEFEGEVSFDIGNYNRYDVSGSVSGPIISDVLGLRLNANYWSEEGFYKDRATLSDLGGGDGYGLALTAKLNASDAISFKGRVEYSTADLDPDAEVLVRNNTGPVNAANNEIFAFAQANGVISASPIALFFGQVPDGSELGFSLMSPDPLTNDRFKGSELDVLRSSLVAEWDVGLGTITSWTGYMNADSKTRQDSDGDAILIGPIGEQIDISPRGSVLDFKMDVEQFSQELRFRSGWAGPLQWTIGGLYWTESADRESHVLTAVCASYLVPCMGGGTSADLVRAVGFVSPDFSSRDIDHWSLYSMLEWEFTDKWKFTAEARYAHEKETVVGPACDLDFMDNATAGLCVDPFRMPPSSASVFGPSSVLADLSTARSVPLEVSSKDDFWTPRYVLEWAPRDDALVYASASKGVKPGGVSTLTAGSWFDLDFDGSVEDLEYDKEKLWSYELGGKFTWFDGLLQTNLAGFLQKYTDKQTSTSILTPSGQPVGVITNAGKAEVWGLELEGLWTPNDYLLFRVGYTFLDTEYTKFAEATDSKSRIVRAGNCTLTDIGGDPFCITDFKGNRLERAPKHSVVGTVNIHGPATLFNLGSNLEWFTETDVIYQGERFEDHENTRWLDDYVLVNLRVGLSAEQWEFLFYVDNVFDDDTVKSANSTTGSVDRLFVPGTALSTTVIDADLPDPQTFGVRASVKF